MVAKLDDNTSGQLDQDLVVRLSVESNLFSKGQDWLCGVKSAPLEVEGRLSIAHFVGSFVIDSILGTREN